MSSAISGWLAEPDSRLLNGRSVQSSERNNGLDESAEQRLHDFFDAVTDSEILDDAEHFQNGTVNTFGFRKMY